MQTSLISCVLLFAFGFNLQVISAFFSKACSNGKQLSTSPSVLSTSFLSKMSNRKETKKDLTAQEDGSSHSTVSETLFGLVGCISDELSQSTLTDASDTLKELTHSVSGTKRAYTSNTSSTSTEYTFIQCIITAAQAMCSIAADPALKKKQAWQALQETAGLLQKAPTESNALAVAFVFGALSLMKDDDAKASASAMLSTVSRNKPLRHAGREIANHVLRAFLVHSSYSDALNLNIITSFAKAFKLTDEQEPEHSELSANVIRFSLVLTVEGYNTSMNEGQEAEEIRKQKVSGALALACQIRPWSVLSPVPLVEAAIPYDYLHAAEQVCVSAHKAAISSAASGNESSNDQPTSSALTEAVTAVETLINAAMEDKTYRRADNIATNLYEEGGKSRYVEARFYHARDTIAKVIHKRQLPIIERQVVRVDTAVAKVEGFEFDNRGTLDDKPAFSASDEIRKFALEQLAEAGEIDGAHRLATLWGMDYVYDENAMLEAAAARRKHYLQLEEVLPGSMIPDLISSPQELRKAFDKFRQYSLFGLDAEWEEDTQGAAVLQLANPKQVLLIDIPALSSTKEGVSSLEDTVGALLDSSDSVVVGFACRQDMSRLRTSPCKRKKHWMSGTSAVVDAQQLVGDDEPKLKKLGLSRVCHHYFGKPLDKAEQCSSWSARPLSERQRVYAALDAWSCVGVYEKIYPSRSSQKETLTVASTNCKD
jgi:hypothetical protein